MNENLPSANTTATGKDFGPRLPAVLKWPPTHELFSSAKGALLSLKNVCKSYESGNGEIVVVLNGVNLEIEPGSFNVIRGESGSGKTSLLRIIGLLDSKFEGHYQFAGDDIKPRPDWYRDELRSANVGFIFQDGQLFNHMAVRENVIVPVRLQGTAEQLRGIQSRIVELAPQFFTEKELNEDDLLSKRPSKVSGGQKQRAAIMRSVINEPAIILADEPTASLDKSRKQEVLDLLLRLREVGNTVIVVSHDEVFYHTGRQLELSDGILRELKPDDAEPTTNANVRTPANAGTILYGWAPRAPFRILISQAIRETFLRPIFLFLVLVSLCLGVCQIAVFSSIIVGAQEFLDDAMTRGSRLNRLEVKPRTGDLDKADRFPVIETIKSWTSIQAIAPRRATIQRVNLANGDDAPLSAMGLSANDQEYRLLNFVAGGPFNPNNQELEAIVTVALLPRLFTDVDGLANGSKQYADFIGRAVTIEVPQFARTGQLLPARVRKVRLTIAGIVLFAEGGRELYLPNRTQLVFDRYKMDRDGVIEMPLNQAGDAWSDRGKIDELVSFPWEDQLQVYTKEIRDVIPVFQQLSKLGYQPASEIWKYKWVLDVRDLAGNIFGPLLVLIVIAVGLTVATNLFSSAKLRESEFALWRILGMRRGDLVITQVISTALMALVGAVMGLLIGSALVDSARSFLAEQVNYGAGGEKIDYGTSLEMVFAPVSQFYVLILVSSVVVSILSAIYPAVRTARTDPAKVLQS